MEKKKKNRNETEWDLLRANVADDAHKYEFNLMKMVRNVHVWKLKIV